MAVPISELKGITDDVAAKLKKKGIANSDKLVEEASTPAQRKALAAHAGCGARDILELTNRADLARVKGIGGVFSDLLEAAGVDTVKELATRRPDNLHQKIVEVNGKKGLTKQPPAQSMVESWVAQAKKLPKTISY